MGRNAGKMMAWIIVIVDAGSNVAHRRQHPAV